MPYEGPLGDYVRKFSEAKAKLDKPDACAGAYSTAKANYDLGTKLYKNLEESLGKVVAKQRKVFNEIREECITAKKGKNAAAPSSSAVQTDCDRLVGLGGPNAKSFAYSTEILFSRHLLETEAELQELRKAQSKFQGESAVLNAKLQSCKGLSAGGQAADKKDPSQKPAKQTLTSKDPKAGDGQKISAPGKKVAGTGIPGGEASTAETPDPGVTEPPPKEDPNAAEIASLKDRLSRVEQQPFGGNLTPPPAPEIPPAVKQAASDTANFVKDNWVWMVGGAAVAGGGYYLYQKDKKEKEKAAWYADDTNWMPYAVAARNNANATSGGDGSGGSTTPPANTNTPPGSHLMITTPITGATTGQAMSPITIVIVDPNGVQLANTGTQIEVSCLTPQPCSLTGGKSATTAGGSVTFTSLMFNQPDLGVKLQFSSPGFPAVTTPNTFDVQGSSPRQ